MKTKIAINLGHNSFKGIEAEIVEIFGHSFGIHRTLNKSGWSCTHIPSGLALAINAKSKEHARSVVVTKINCHGLERFEALIAKHPAPPSVDTLELYKAPVREETPTVDLRKLVDAIAGAVGGLSEQEAQAVRSALSSRTGRLKSKAPSDDWGKAAWNGLQPNAWKIQFSACFLRGDAAEFMTRLSKVAWPAALDKDLHTLRKLGVA